MHIKSFKLSDDCYFKCVHNFQLGRNYRNAMMNPRRILEVGFLVIFTYSLYSTLGKLDIFLQCHRSLIALFLETCG